MHSYVRILSGLIVSALAALTAPASLSAGVANPNLSALGQVRAGFTDDAGSADPEEPTLALGEAEFILDAALNPYLNGAFVIAAGEEGFALEEAYASVQRGLPFGLGLKAGQYRLGFGKLNAVHPHAYPFLDAPRAWASLLPDGEEGFKDVAVQASILLPMPGDWASTLSADVLRGAPFHPDEEETRLGWLGRWSNSFLLGDLGALEAGASAATGKDLVAEDRQGWLYGGDLKAKFYFDQGSQLVLQGEGAFRRSHGADSAAGVTSEERFGMYAFADYRYHARWNIGILYDQVQRQGDAGMVDRSIKPFAGFAVMEETTMLRLAYEYFMPDGEDAVQTLALQFLFSMGPHKPHQF